MNPSELMRRTRELMDRIRKLEEWQKHQILVGILYKLDEVELQGVKEEVEEYEQMNKEDN